MSARLIDELVSFIMEGGIDRDFVRVKIANLTDWQASTIREFYGKGRGVLKMTEMQVFTTGRYNVFSKYYEQEKVQVQQLIDEGYLIKTDGVTVGHNRYQLTFKGMVLMVHLAELVDEARIPDPTEIDWSQFTSQDDWEKIVKLIGPPDDVTREYVPEHIFLLIPIYGDACELEWKDPGLFRMIEDAQSDAAQAAEEGQ